MSLSVFTVAALVLLFAVSLNADRAQLMQDRQQKLRNLVEVIHATAAHFEGGQRGPDVDGRCEEGDQGSGPRDPLRQRTNTSGSTTSTT